MDEILRVRETSERSTPYIPAEIISSRVAIRLRLLYELNPMAFLMEQAGGAASNGNMPILDIKPESLDQRSPVFIGSPEDVSKAIEYINEV
jgi:fructose-1,6-bisphosphatase